MVGRIINMLMSTYFTFHPPALPPPPGAHRFAETVIDGSSAGVVYIRGTIDEFVT